MASFCPTTYENFFLWLILHDHVLINANRLKRQLSIDPRCTICGAIEETTLHILRDCHAARMIWYNTRGSGLHDEFYYVDLRSWIILNLQDKGRNLLEGWLTLFTVKVWWLWKWRNCAVFGRNSTIPNAIGTFLRVKFIK